jgi:hypothetical protein
LRTSQAELPAGNQAGLCGSPPPTVWNHILAARGLGTASTTPHLA